MRIPVRRPLGLCAVTLLTGLGCAVSSGVTTDRATDPNALRRHRVAHLIAVYDAAKLSEDAQDRARVQLRCMAELAQIRFELGQVDAAGSAIEKALEVARVAFEGPVTAGLIRDLLDVRRVQAFELALRGRNDEAVGRIDELALRPDLNPELLSDLQGDRALVSEFVNAEEIERERIFRRGLMRVSGARSGSTASLRVSIARRLGDSTMRAAKPIEVVGKQQRIDREAEAALPPPASP